jgi:hypothetical protein
VSADDADYEGKVNNISQQLEGITLSSSTPKPVGIWTVGWDTDVVLDVEADKPKSGMITMVYTASPLFSLKVLMPIILIAARGITLFYSRGRCLFDRWWSKCTNYTDTRLD